MDSKVRIKTLLIAGLAISSLVSWQALAQQPISGTLKDTNSGNSYTVTITPTVAAPTPAPTPDPIPVPDPDQPQASAAIPLTFDADQFAGNSVAPSTRVASGGSIKNKTITDTGSTASIVTSGAALIDNVRINSREGIRVGASGTVTINGSYIEVNGVGDDHADGVQAYAPGSKGIINVLNSTIKCGKDSATAGFFVADNWTGDVNLENVVFSGGPYGLRLHSDKGGDINVSLKDVYFIGPFGFSRFYFLNYGGKKVVVKKWENVRQATIVNGKLIPGDPIQRPN